MSSSQSFAAVVSDPSTIEEIKTMLYVDRARLKVLSQETKLHVADNDDATRGRAVRAAGGSRPCR
jgi:hypothetical protein